MTREEWEVLHAQKLALEVDRDAYARLLDKLEYIGGEMIHRIKVKYSKTMSEIIRLERLGA